MHAIKRYSALFLLIVSMGGYPELSRAEDYYWLANSSNSSTKFSSATAVCEYWFSASTVAVKRPIVSTIYNSGASVKCTATFSGSAGFGIGYGTRLGDSCKSPSVYNSETGGCEAPLEPNGEVCGPAGVTGLPQIKNSSGECVDFVFADKASQCKYAKNSVREVSVRVEFDSNGVPSGPPDTSFGGCAAVPIGASPYANCKQSAPRKACTNGICVEMQSDTAKCSVAVQFTGETAEGEFGFTGDSGDGVGPCDPASDCTPEAPVVSENQPCVYYSPGEGMVSCTSFDYKGVPGETSNCGSVNGEAYNCNYKKVPQSTGKQIDTTVETKTNSDGSTTTTKTDVRTDVNCIGAGSCSSTTTKTTVVTNKDSSGNTTGTTTECTGSKCGTSGTGDGTGTGEGDCTVDCDDEEGTVAGPELGEVSGFAESMSDFMSGVRQTPLITAISGIGLSGGGSCSFPSATTIIGTISFDFICNNSNWLDPLYAVFLACWALASVRVLMSA